MVDRLAATVRRGVFSVIGAEGSLRVPEMMGLLEGRADDGATVSNRAVVSTVDRVGLRGGCRVVVEEAVGLLSTVGGIGIPWPGWLSEVNAVGWTTGGDSRVRDVSCPGVGVVWIEVDSITLGGSSVGAVEKGSEGSLTKAFELMGMILSFVMTDARTNGFTWVMVAAGKLAADGGDLCGEDELPVEVTTPWRTSLYEGVACCLV